MLEVGSSEVIRDFTKYRELVEADNPVLIMNYNKPSIVMISADEYVRLKKRDRIVGKTEDISIWLANKIENTKMDARFNYLDE